MIPQNRWRWGGVAGHFVAGNDCRFHLLTLVGKYRISTVGDYHPPGSEDQPAQDIGLNRTYETFVFMSGKRIPGGEGCECLICCNPVANWSNVDQLPANTPAEAEKNHMKLCRKYARRQGTKETQRGKT